MIVAAWLELALLISNPKHSAHDKNRNQEDRGPCISYAILGVIFVIRFVTHAKPTLKNV